MTTADSGLHALRAASRGILGEVTWPTCMPEIVEAQGLKNVVVERKTKENYPKQYASFWTEGILAAAIDGLGKIPEGEMKEKMARLVEGAGEDASKGIAWCGDHLVVVGRKPLEG